MAQFPCCRRAAYRPALLHDVLSVWKFRALPDSQGTCRRSDGFPDIPWKWYWNGRVLRKCPWCFPAAQPFGKGGWDNPSFPFLPHLTIKILYSRIAFLVKIISCPDFPYRDMGKRWYPYMEIHQHTPKLSIIVAQYLLHGSS